MKIGVIACDMIKRELAPLIADDPDITEVVWLEAALHVYPEKMKTAIVEQIEAIAPSVDVVFLGYGFCQSLKGVEELVDVPVVMPQFDDCISIMITPERYEAEKKVEIGTWFMTPGWAEVGAEMVIKELHLDRATRYGKDPMDMAKRLFTHYRRGLYLDNGVGDEKTRSLAKAFCEDFSLRYEESTAESPILADHLAKAKRLAADRQSRSGAIGEDGSCEAS